MAFVIFGVMSILTMHSCQSTTASAPVNPINLAKNATAGICANQQAVAAAGSGDDSTIGVTIPKDLAAQLQNADSAAAATLAQTANCATTTTSP